MGDRRRFTFNMSMAIRKLGSQNGWYLSDDEVHQIHFRRYLTDDGKARTMFHPNLELTVDASVKKAEWEDKIELYAMTIAVRNTRLYSLIRDSLGHRKNNRWIGKTFLQARQDAMKRLRSFDAMGIPRSSLH